MTLSAFPEKIPEIEKKNLTFLRASPNGAPNSTDQSHPISISRAPANITITSFHFRLTVKIKGNSYNKN